ncbi:hypothetical protein UCDSB2_390001 [Tenacibaculum maritimum]|nr:hypothetical protein NCIMB2158_190011 [Tenacibaculum maritimum]CAA0221529.1 hypothetical protein UCDSB2_390001 [Tenacibaculum maritimum]
MLPVKVRAILECKDKRIEGEISVVKYYFSDKLAICDKGRESSNRSSNKAQKRAANKYKKVVGNYKSNSKSKLKYFV